MEFLPVKVNRNVYLIPNDEELITDGDEAVLLCQVNYKKSKKKKEEVSQFRRLKSIRIKPHTDIVIVSLNPWEARSFKQANNMDVTAGLIVDKSLVFRDDPVSEPTYLYFGGLTEVKLVEFNSYEDAALWAVVQQPLLLAAEED